MLFSVEWATPVENRVAVWNAFGNMSEEDHVKTQGSVKLLNRYHKMAGDSGVNIAEADNMEDVMKWCMNWSHLAEIKVYPVVGDSESKKCIQASSLFEKKEESEESGEEETIDDSSKGKMLVLIDYKTPVENRVTVWNAFGNLSEKNELKTRGSVKMLSRYHKLAGDSGFAIAETDNTKDLMKWLMNWSHVAEMNVYPVLGESDAKKCVQESLLFEKKE